MFKYKNIKPNNAYKLKLNLKYFVKYKTSIYKITTVNYKLLSLVL